MMHVRSLTRGAAAALLVLALTATGRGQDFEKALLRVLLPAEDAKLEIQGQVSKKTGTVRLFESPLLAPGKAFVYDLKVSWTENGKIVTREKTARVMAGQTTEVDLRVEDKPLVLNPGPPKPADPKPADPKPI